MTLPVHRAPAQYVLAAFAFITLVAPAAPGEGPRFPADDTAVKAHGPLRIERLAVLGDDPAARAVTVDGSHLFVGFGQRLVVQDRPQDVALPVAGSIELAGDIIALEVDDPWVYALTRRALDVVDVSDPTLPRLAAVVPRDDVYQGDLALDRGFLYLGDPGGLGVYSLDVPGRPRLLTQLPSLGSVVGLSANGSRLALTNLQQLVMLDVSTPAAPIEQARLDLPTDPGVYCYGCPAPVLLREDGLAVVAAFVDEARLLVADLRPGQAPHWLDPDGQALGSDAVALAGEGSYVYVATGGAIGRLDLRPGEPPSAIAWWPLDREQVSDLALYQRRLYAATERGVVQVLDFPDHGDEGLTVLAEHEIADPEKAQMATSAGRAYVTSATPGTVEELDLTTQPEPTLLGTVTGLGEIAALAAFDDMLLVASRRATLTLLDLANPASPRPGWTLSGTLFSELAVGPGELVYGASPDEGLVVLDPRNMAAPIVLAQLRLAEDAPGASELLVEGPRAYLLGPALGLAVVDIADPARPRLLGRLRLPGDAPVGLARTADALVVAQDGQLLVVDVDTPTDPAIVARFPLPTGIGEPVDVGVLGGSVQVACAGGERWARGGVLASIRIADRTKPQLLSVTTISARRLLDLGDDQALALGGDKQGGKLWRLRLAHAVQYEPGANVQLTGGTANVVMRDGIALVAGGPQGLHVVDVRDPSEPKLLETILQDDSPWELALDGDRAYVESRGRLTVLDVSAPATPRVLGQSTLGDTGGDIVARGNLLVRAAWHPAPVGLQLETWEVSVPAGPRLLGSVSLDDPLSAMGLAMSTGVALVTSYSGDLTLVDITDPGRPAVMSRLHLGLDANDVAVVGDRAFVPVIGHSGELRLTTVDIHDPAQPRIVAETPYDGISYLSHVAVAGKRAWVTDWLGGLGVFDISDPDLPRLLARYRAPEADPNTSVSVAGLAVTEDHAYLATSNSILWSLRLTDAPCSGTCVFLPFTVRP